MKTMRILIFTVFLYLLNIGYVIAENVNVSGYWQPRSTNDVHGTCHSDYTAIYKSGDQKTWSTDETYNDSDIYYPMMNDVIQYSDGSFFSYTSAHGPMGGIVSGYEDITTTLTGTVSGNFVTFQITDIDEQTYSYGYVWHEGWTTVTYKHAYTGNFSGSILGRTITGTAEGFHTDTYHIVCNGGDDMYPGIAYEDIFIALSFAGAFKVALPASPNPIQPSPPIPNPPLDSQLGKPLDSAKTAGDPINSVTGNMHIIAPDLTIPSPGINFSFIRTYNNQAGQVGPLGFDWTHSYNIYLTQDVATNTVKIKDEEAKGYLFADNGNGTFASQRGEYSTLIKNTNGFIWTKKDGKTYIFDLSGRLNQIKDRNNNTINLSYNTQNQLTVITDTCGRQVNLSYNAQGMIAALTGPSGRAFIYDYDSNGNLTTVTDPDGNNTTYEYDSNHNLTKKIDALGQSTSFTYDGLNRCTSSSGENNLGFTTLSFDPANKKTAITNSKGNITTQYYNDDLLITKTINAQGGQTTSSWDTNLNLISRTDELSRVTSFAYDAKGNLTNVTNPAGNSTQFTYEPSFNLLASSTDAMGNVTTYTRDTHGNPTASTDAYQNSTVYTYNTAGQVTSVKNTLGNTTSFDYDIQGNLIHIKDAQGNITTLSYDAVGNITQCKDAGSNITSFDYDDLNQLTQVTYADNTTVNYGYDAVGNRTQVTNADNNITDYTYDQLHHLTSTRDALGGVIDYTYDTEENLARVTDQNNNETTYEYDSLNRLILKTDAMNNKTQYQYDAAGNHIALTDAKGKTSKFQYDKLNRIIKAMYPGSTISYTYDALGRRAAMTDASGIAAYTYDKLGRLMSIANSKANNSISYTYDKMGNRLSFTDPDGRITNYAYDSLNRLISVTDADGKITTYTYDSVSNLTALLYPNSVKETYLYDNMNRLLKLTQQKTAAPAVTLSELTYTYDDLGRKIRIGFLDGSYITYTYDRIGELLSESKTSPGSSSIVTYEYDPVGNRTHMTDNGLERTYSYNSLNQLTEEDTRDTGSRTTKITVTGKVTDPSGVKEVTINGKKAKISADTFTLAEVGLINGSNTIAVVAADKVGNTATKLVHVKYEPVKQVIYAYDHNGNLVKKSWLKNKVKFKYDGRNLLKRYSAPGFHETYAYDGDGKRVSLKSGTNTTSYLYDGMNVIAERNKTGLTTANYIRNPGLPGGIGGIISSQLESASSTYYSYDGLGSVINLTNSLGSVTQSYNYSAFGNVTNKSGTSTNSHQFLTKEADASGLVYFGARYYNPVTGRFITQDPMGMVDGPNLYVYCRNNPVNWVDPWGLCRNADADSDNKYETVRFRTFEYILEQTYKVAREERHTPLEPPPGGSPPTGMDDLIYLIGKIKGWF